MELQPLHHLLICVTSNSEMFDTRLDRLYVRHVQQTINTSMDLMSAPHFRGQPRHMHDIVLPANQMLSCMTLEQQHISKHKFMADSTPC